MGNTQATTGGPFFLIAPTFSSLLVALRYDAATER
jgi:hypothetical protein